MEPWKLYAFAAALFAGITAVVAKAGLKNLSADLGLTVRATFVLVFVITNLLMWTKAAPAMAEIKMGGLKSTLLLAFSALTTTLSWICYYRAMKDGTVSFVSLIDKGSILVTIALSVLLLGEPLTGRIALGATLITTGLLVLAGGK